MSLNPNSAERSHSSSPAPISSDERENLLETRPTSTTSTRANNESSASTISPPTQTPRYRTLSPSDHATLILKLTGQEQDSESQQQSQSQPSINLPTPHLLWPLSHTLPSSLYTDVLHARQKAQYQFYISSTLHNTCLLLQLILGATITALSSGSGIISSDKLGKLSLTVLGALNTVLAGVLALLHNSGLPDRMYNNWKEYAGVESWLREVLVTGVVEEERGVEDVVLEGWRRFRVAGETVRRNRPASWIGSGSGSGFDLGLGR